MKTPKGNGTCQRIDGKALGWALAKAQITLDDVKAQNGHRLSEPGWNRMLGGFRAEPKSWLIICNLLGVPLNAFDLPAAGVGEQAGPGNRGPLGHLGDHYASGESEALAALRQSLRAMGFPAVDDDASPRPLPIRNEDTARSALPGLLANLGQCLLCILPRSARPPARPQVPTGAALEELDRQLRNAPGAAASSRKSSPIQTKIQNRARRVPSPKAATPPPAKQAANRPARKSPTA